MKIGRKVIIKDCEVCRVFEEEDSCIGKTGVIVDVLTDGDILVNPDGPLSAVPYHRGQLRYLNNRKVLP